MGRDKNLIELFTRAQILDIRALWFPMLNVKQQKHHLIPVFFITDNQLNKLFLDFRFPFFILLICYISLPLMLVK